MTDHLESLIVQIETDVTSLKEDFYKLINKNNKAAGRRARKTTMLLKKTLSDLRVGLLACYKTDQAIKEKATT